LKNVAPNADICFPKIEKIAYFADGMRILTNTAIHLSWKTIYRIMIRYIAVREKYVQINFSVFNVLLFIVSDADRVMRKSKSLILDPLGLHPAEA